MSIPVFIASQSLAQGSQYWARVFRHQTQSETDVVFLPYLVACQVVKRTETQDTEMKKQLTAAQNAAKQHKQEASRLAKELKQALKVHFCWHTTPYDTP